MIGKEISKKFNRSKNNKKKNGNIAKIKPDKEYCKRLKNQSPF